MDLVAYQRKQSRKCQLNDCYKTRYNKELYKLPKSLDETTLFFGSVINATKTELLLKSYVFYVNSEFTKSL